MTGLIIDIEVLRELLNKRAPQINQSLDQFGLPLAVITTKWLICLFAEVLPIETVLRIWDCIFLEGYKVSVFNWQSEIRFWIISTEKYRISDIVSSQFNAPSQPERCYFTDWRYIQFSQSTAWYAQRANGDELPSIHQQYIFGAWNIKEIWDRSTT